WDWTGDTEGNRKFAENGFRKQMKRLAGLSCDIAFFPVDGRLGPSMERGAKVFCAETNPRALVAMHSVGYPAWQPSADFFAKGREIPVWSPCTAGERHKFSNFG
ncbi:MAG: MBL fold metallo-hydrolase, partial [Selenomonas sp.]|nr:MBL fold metallo-hydrolase [Selenomonas sp.]